MEADKTICPVHGTGAVMNGTAKVLMDNLPAAHVGSKIQCADGTPDVVLTGAATVLVANQPVARRGELSVHGAMVQGNGSKVLIGGRSTSATVASALGELLIVPDGQALVGTAITKAEYVRMQRELQIPEHDWDIWDGVGLALDRAAGGTPHTLRWYKTQWVADHAVSIIVAARMNHLPPELVAGIAFAEVGGDPNVWDDIGHAVRTIVPTGLSRPPEETSFGDLSIQIRRAAEVLGVRSRPLSLRDRMAIIDMLRNDQAILRIVGRHLADLRNIDFPGARSLDMSDDEMRVTATRYNRGPDISLDAVLHRGGKTSYGDSIVKRRAWLADLLRRAQHSDAFAFSGPQPASRGTTGL